MKKIFIAILLCFAAQLSWAQVAKKPTIMILPSDHWCTTRYFTKKFENMGEKKVINDYDRALREDNELAVILSKVGELMTDRGYYLKDYAQEQRKINDNATEEAALISTQGGVIYETPIDILRRRSKHDIELCLDWQISSQGHKHNLNFTIEAFDTYTLKRIATANGNHTFENEPIPVAFEEAVCKYIKPFDKQLTEYMKLKQNEGREIVLSIHTWDNTDINLEKEYDGEELGTIIENWMYDNTVRNSFSTADLTRSRALFEQVMIPYFDKRGRALDARGFTMGLRKHLKDAYGITSKISTRGLGEAILVLGSK